ncbi:MAG TPA: YciI family protein [Streptosporangiaceae bacterium]|nr:YciI family protein [Streptosporangiaceae bacterium]
MRYLCLLVGEPDMAAAAPAPGTPEFMQMLSEYRSATDAMQAAGVLVDSGPLQPESSATTLRVRDGEPLVTDGPFAELKEQIGGYYVLDCADLDEALRWVATIPAARYGCVDLRPVMDMTG